MKLMNVLGIAAGTLAVAGLAITARDYFKGAKSTGSLTGGGPLPSQLQAGDSFNAPVGGQTHVFEALAAADPATQTILGLDGNTGNRQVVPLSMITATQRGV